MAVTSLAYSTALTTVETIDSGAPAAASGQTVTQNGFNTSLRLSSASVPPVTDGVKEVVTLSAGAAVIDVTSLSGINGEAKTASGYKIRAIKFHCPSSNANPITVSKGASNGYTGLGGSFDVEIYPGGEFVWFDGGNGTAVSSTNKTFALAGTGSTDTVNFEVVWGS